MKELENLNTSDLQKAYLVIQNKIKEIEGSGKFVEDEYGNLLQKRIYLSQKLNKVDEIILDTVRREKYPSREEYILHNNIKIILEQKNLFLHNSQTVVSTIHAKKYFYFSDRGASSDFLKRLGESFIREQLEKITNKEKFDFITLEHPSLSIPLSHHILYYNDEKKLDLQTLKDGIAHVIEDIEKRKLSNISFFGLGFYYVLTAEENDRPEIASTIASEVAETIVSYFENKTNSSVKTIYFGFVNNKTMNTFDKAFYKWTSLSRQGLYILGELTRIQKNLIETNHTTDNKFKEVLKDISYSLSDKSIILLLGETGVGKSYIAKKLHENSPRSSKPFLSINCAILKSERAESSLFGHVKGAFTGATNETKGAIEKNNTGTLFLDEIGALDLDVQKMLLTFLDEGYFYRMGDYENEIKSDVKIILGTNSNLEELVASRQFAPDLYERISQRVFEIPPLRERRGDIENLVNHFVEDLNQVKKYPMEIKEAIPILSSYNWYGNIRELRFYIEKLYNKCQSQALNNISKRMVLDNPPRENPLLSDSDRLLEKQLSHLMDRWNSNNGRLLKDILEPIIAKLYLDKKLPVVSSSKFLGIVGSKGTNSPLRIQSAKYPEAMKKLKQL